MKKSKQRQQLDSFHLLHIVHYLHKGGVEIIHEPSWYDKEQLPSMKSTQLVLFDEVHIQQISGPPVTRKVNKHNIQFPGDEEGNVDV